MAITLRLSDNTPAGKVTELSYDDMNDNLRSFYYSSSFQSNTLVLYTTGSVSHSISLAAFLDDTNTNIYNSDGTLTEPRTVTANENQLSFDFTDADFQITTGGGVGGDLKIQDLREASTDSLLMIDPSTGVVSWMDSSSMNYYDSASVNLNTLTLHRGNGGTSVITIDTGSGGGSTSPSGSTGEVQFNNAGTFGADPNFTWNTTDNALTLKGVTSGPSLRLANEIPINTEGLTLGYLAVYQDSVAAADIAGIKVKSEATFTNGDVPTRMEFLTTPDGTETPTVKVTIKENGRVGVGTAAPANGFFEVNGNVSGTSIYASANVVAYSDARSKTNIETIPNALNKVTSIRGVTYNKVEDPDGVKYMGVVAQELLPYLPEVVAQGESGEYAVAYGNIVGVLIEAIKELKAEIDELKANK